MQPKICMSYAIVIIIWFYMQKGAASDPGLHFLVRGCNANNVSSLSAFTANLNSTFKQLRRQLNNGTLFATAQQQSGSDPVYGLIQCRGYMSTADCVACFNQASISIVRECPGSIGARIIYDGCYLRYESNDRFYGDGTNDANIGLCDNRTTTAPNATFQAALQGVFSDLANATWKTKDYYAATKKKVEGTANMTVYAIAQCLQAAVPRVCEECLQVAASNLRVCSNIADGRAVDSGCFMRYSDRPFFADNQTTNLKPFLQNKSSSLKRALIIGGVVGGVIVLLVLLALYVWYKISIKRIENPRGDLLGATELRGPTSYNYKDLKAATDNFKEDNKLGQGGFGGVYKGTLKNGKIVAVKKLSVQSNSAKEDFKSEVTLISNVHHRNLVRLLGCCDEGPELLLVYEYMANKSLDSFLFGKQRSLNWKQRFDVIVGTAQGLAYLHEQFHACIIHRDIKPGNILLGDAFQPKIADFGLARLLPYSKTHVNTRVAGTLGYTAPEYCIRGQLSEKVDTYSYGIVVLEIISGKRCNEMSDDPAGEYLLKRAWNLYENGKHAELVDQRLDPSEFEVEDVKRIIEIALICTQSSPTSRPTMSEVVVLLKSKNSLVEGPRSKPPFLELERRAREIDKAISNAKVSITEMSGR